MYCSLMVLHQWSVVLLSHNLFDKILYLLLDLRLIVGYLEMHDETIQGPKRSLTVL